MVKQKPSDAEKLAEEMGVGLHVAQLALLHRDNDYRFAKEYIEGMNKPRSHGDERFPLWTRKKNGRI
jgi:hypothetical protein